MTTNDSPRFRPTPTLWPSEPRALPPVALWDRPYDPTSPNVGFVALPDDYVFREVLEVTAERLDGFCAQWGRFADSSDIDPVSGVPAPVQLRNRAAWRVGLLQTLARHYIAYSRDDDEGVLDAWRAGGVEMTHTQTASATEVAWGFWETQVNEALRAFPMVIRTTATTGDQMAELQGRTTYEVAVLQLAQAMAEGREVRRCANELCPYTGWMTRQRSDRRRYDGTAHASGVRYCTSSCAKAQAERERRRRVKATRGV